jgi:phosphohistidine phosphatase
MPPCELYLIRHAIAADRGDDWPDDDKRPLTERGNARFKEAVAGLLGLDAAVDEIFTSPLVRARQTAQLLSAGLGGTPPVKLLDALAPGHGPDEVMAELEKAAKRRRIALVGHEPELGELAARLIGARRPLAFRKGSVCRIDIDGFTGERPGGLVWFIHPKALRLMGRGGP